MLGPRAADAALEFHGRLAAAVHDRDRDLPPQGGAALRGVVAGACGNIHAAALRAFPVRRGGVPGDTGARDPRPGAGQGVGRFVHGAFQARARRLLRRSVSAVPGDQFAADRHRRVDIRRAPVSGGFSKNVKTRS